MLTSRLVLCLALSALLPSVASADEVVLSASRAAKLPTEAEIAKAKAEADAKADQAFKPDTKAQVIAALTNTTPVTRTEPVAPVHVASAGDNTGGRTIHGEAGVSIGTGGYRSAYVSALIPVGENGTLGIAYSQTDFGKNGVPFYSYDGYTPAYGYSYGNRNRLSGRSLKSVALSYTSSNDDHAADTPEGCAPGFRDGGRYVEPLWVAARNDHSCLDASQR